jgi:hypothetical protein
MICNVRDLLPHLGEGFVQLCLQHYEYKAGVVACLPGFLPFYSKRNPLKMKVVFTKEEFIIQCFKFNLLEGTG